MKRFQLTIGALALTISAFAQEPAMTGESAKPASDALGRLAVSAAEDLARSTRELSELREKIAAEKLPLAEKLGSAEDKLSSLRKEYERVTRLVDSGNLELTTIKAETRAREDELTYVGNVLDEYARSFESKVNIAELQYAGEALQAAKRATENQTLSISDKFRRQTDFVNASITRLFDGVGGMRFPGAGVDMQGNVQQGRFALIGPVALFRSDDGTASGLVIPQAESTNPLIRPLEGDMQAGIGPLVENGEGAFPFDPTRGGALKAMSHKTDLREIYKKGGPIMHPLAFISVLAILTVLERVLFLLNEGRKRDGKALERFFEALKTGNVDKAVAISGKSKYFLLRALSYALTHKERSLSNALIYAQEREMKRFRRGIPILDTVITLAPLLGLLGTVTGMMASFSLIGGELSAPGAITGGIAEALIATAFGLGIAITSLIPFNYLNTKLEEARIEIETAATQLELLMHPSEVAEAAAREELAAAV